MNNDIKLKKIKFNLPVISFFTVIVLCVLVLFAGENRGVSDNGDFRRVMLVNNLEYKDASDSNYLFKQYYTMKVEGNGITENIKSVFSTSEDKLYSSPHFVFIKLSKLLNYASNLICHRPVTYYNIMYLAFLYILVLAYSLYLIERFLAKYGTKAQITAALLFMLIFCDLGYICYFNSFYGEPLQYVAMMAAIGFGLNLIEKPKDCFKLVCFFISLYFFAGSKLVNIPLAIIAALFSLALVFKEKSKPFKAAVVSLVLIFTAVTGSMAVYVPEWMDYDTTYQSVFFGILKESDTVKKDLNELGIDEKYACLANTNAYMTGYPIDIHNEQFKKDFYEKINKVDVAVFYIKHPVRLFKNTVISLADSAYIRPMYLGNSPYERMEQSYRWSIWSIFRVKTRFLYNPFFVFFLLIFTVLLSVLYMIKRKSLIALPFILLAGAVFENLILPYMLNGAADLSKHMFLFVTLTDIAFFSAVMIAVLNNKKIKYKRYIFAAALCITAVCAVAGILSSPSEIKFGTLNNEKISWEIIRENDDGTVRMISKKPIAFCEFDTSGEFGSNLWSKSTLRKYLNGDFLSCFDDEELERIVKTENKVYIADAYSEEKDGGSRAKFWSANPKRLDYGNEDAYYQLVSDRIFLPSLSDVMNKQFVNQSPFWIIDAYGGNANMVRASDRNGYIIFKDAKTPLGVRPVITVRLK